jgi:AraC family transcriptional regulator
MLLDRSHAFSAALDGIAQSTPAAAPAPVQIDPGIRGGLPPRALRRVCEYIEAHLQENISLQVLADIAGKSKHHFARAFKQSEGLPPHEYLVQHRVRRAQELLTGTNLPLAEIALASGFSDQSHCARRFRKHVGLTPSRYRWLMR